MANQSKLINTLRSGENCSSSSLAKSSTNNFTGKFKYFLFIRQELKKLLGAVHPVEGVSEILKNKKKELLVVVQTSQTLQSENF